MSVRLLCSAGQVSLLCTAAAGFDRRRRLDGAALLPLPARYAAARASGDEPALLAIGHALWRWLDGAEGWLGDLWPTRPYPFEFEVEAPLDPNSQGWAVLHAPWELLADPARPGFLAADATLGFAPARRLGSASPSPEPDGYRLGIAFMAAAPPGQRELDFEAEEAAILNAAMADIDLLVEETGEAARLGQRLARLTPTWPVLHLSCHGHNAWRGDSGKDAPQPVLLLEDAKGTAAPTPAAGWRDGAGQYRPGLIDALGTCRPRLLFLSACLTASAAEAGGGKAAPEALSDTLASRLVRAGFPAVLGWDGSVADVAATAFAREIYGHLGNGVAPAAAAAAARRKLLNGPAAPTAPGLTEPKKDAAGAAQLSALLQAEASTLRRDWHLARVWLGPSGGGALVGGAMLPRSLRAPAHKQVLAAKFDEKLEVADPVMFVGRRRELQRALRVLDGSDHVGVLLHGMGRLGKSSLAARIADRRPDLRLAVLFGAYDALSVIEALERALAEHPPAMALLAARRSAVRDQGPPALRSLLVALLSGPCAGTRPEHQPLLLLLDDLERILDADPSGGRHRIQPPERAVLEAVLGAFDVASTRSRLLVTSRFAFTLPDGRQDLATRLAAIELGEFSDTARRKLALRQIRAAQAEADGAPLTDAALNERLSLLARTQSAARGNPGLQDLLGADFVLRPEVPVPQATAVLDEMESWLDGGEAPHEEAVRAFLWNLKLDDLMRLAGPSGCELLRAMTLFHESVPATVVDVLQHTMGGAAQRLSDLGLLVPGDDLVVHARPALAANGLAAGRLTPLAQPEAQVLGQLALPALFHAWGGTDRMRRPYAADIELTRLGLLAEDAGVVETCAADAVRGVADTGHPAAAGALGEAAVALLEAAGQSPPLRLLARVAEALQQAGEGARAGAILAKGPVRPDGGSAEETGYLWVLGNRQLQTGDLDGAWATFQRKAELDKAAGRPRDVAIAQAQMAEILARRGQPDEALRLLRAEIVPALDELGEDREAAGAKGRIADVLEARGELEEALRIRREEELPVFERLGDVRSAAVTRGQIADVLQARGELEEALRIRREETLPVYERLGDVRSAALTRGQIADVLQARGELEEALRIRREEELPVYERLGDVRSAAVTRGKIADVLQARGELEEALRIRREEELPVFERLGDVRSAALTRGKIADVLQARGELEEALRIRREETLPVYERLGDVRSAALTRGKIADVLQARGELEEALRIRREETLPVYERLGDVRSAALTRGKIADVLEARGELEEALRIRREEELPVYERLGDVRSAAVTRGQIADVLQARGELEEALRIRREEELPVFERLGDVRSAAVTRGKIADVLQARGELEEALRIRREETLPVYERLGDVRSAALTRGKIANVLATKGDLEDALTLQEERLAVNRHLGDLDGIAATQWDIARIALAREQFEEAIPCLTEAWTLFEKLGRADGLAVVGEVFGQVLIANDMPTDANEVLRRSALAYRKLGRIPEAEHVESLIRTTPTDKASEEPAP